MTPTDHAELARQAEIISDEEIARVHGHANFGSISPREVVNDGVRKYAVGYHSGHTQLCILMEHGLITKPRPGRYDANLTKKGKKYARVLYRNQSALLAEIAALRGREATVLEGECACCVLTRAQCADTVAQIEIGRTQAERQRDEAVGLLRPFAEAADNLDERTRDHDDIWEQPAAMSIDAGNLRDARTLLTSMEPKT